MEMLLRGDVLLRLRQQGVQTTTNVVTPSGGYVGFRRKRWDDGGRLPVRALMELRRGRARALVRIPAEASPGMAGVARAERCGPPAYRV